MFWSMFDGTTDVGRSLKLAESPYRSGPPVFVPREKEFRIGGLLGVYGACRASEYSKASILSASGVLHISTFVLTCDFESRESEVHVPK